MGYRWNILSVVFLCFCAESFQDGNLVLLNDAVKDGAICLDGSAPGYYFRPGTGAGAKKWIFYLQGGGWCFDDEQCFNRSKTDLGSSKNWPKTQSLRGFLSDDVHINPDFYNYNVAYVRYCDGASFAGNLEKPLNINGTLIYYRGFRVLNAVLKDVLARGMNDAVDVILTGCSAGGLATYFHADYVGSFLPKSSTYSAVSDAGYFIDGKNIYGQYSLRTRYQSAFNMQNCSGGVNQECITAQKPGEEWKCFFAQYTYQHIKSRFFSVNSQVDTWQLKGILQLGCVPPNCTNDQMKQFESFYMEFKEAETPIVNSQDNGAFLDSCLMHCHVEIEEAWIGLTVNGQSLRETVGRWHFEDTDFAWKVIDCAYPCNKSCLSVKF